MHAASRSALKRATEHLTEVIGRAGDSTAAAAQTGTEIFDVVDVLDSDRALRVAVAEASTSGERRAGLVEELFGGKTAATTLDVIKAAAADAWSTTGEMRAGLVELGRRSLLTAAEGMGQLSQVEDELFRLSRILEREGKLTQLLSDRTATAERKRSLLTAVLYGKVAPVTEVLALQAIGRPEHGPIEDLAALSELAAAMQGKTVAHVVSAAELSDEQTRTLEDKLGRMYGHEMIIHPEIDPSLLGGMVVRVGHEVIDGSTKGKIERLRAQLT